MILVRTLYDLEAWKVARDLRKQIAVIAKQFPHAERYRLTDQIIRSSRSVGANIAEGFGRYSFKDSAHYFRQARGSLIETLEHISCAGDEGYIDEMTVHKLREQADMCGRLLNGLIRSQMRHGS